MNIDGQDLFNKLKVLSRKLPTIHEPQKVLELLWTQNYVDSFPNVHIALEFLLTLPVSVESEEGSFSKLKLIKPYLRPLMTQKKFSNRKKETCIVSL